jgi:two-component system, NarL family, response regulator DegU
MSVPHLTPRERDILILICDDLTVQQIALKLGVTDKTIYYHQPRLYTKLGVSGPAGALRWAIEAGIVEMPRQRRKTLTRAV